MNGARHDARHCTAPPRMYRGHIAGRRMGYQHWHAVSGACRHRETFRANEEGVPFHIAQGLSGIERRDLSHIGPVDLSLLEQAIVGDPQTVRKAHAVLADRIIVVTQVKSEVQRIVRRGAHPTRTCRERMSKPVPIQKGGMQSTHSVVSSMASLHGPLRHAKEAAPSPGRELASASISFRRVDRGAQGRPQQRPSLSRGG
jgi:hypothetical protein